MIDKVIPLGSPAAPLMTEFIRLLTRKSLVIWQPADEEEPDAGFAADLNLGSGSDLAISVNREENRFTASIVWNIDEEALLQPAAEGGAEIHVPEEITAAVDAKLYAEVEKAYHDAEKVSG